MNMCIHPQEEAPLPWSYKLVDDNDNMFSFYTIIDATGKSIIDINDDEELAKKIIKVNNHAALVEALKETLALLRTSLAPDGMFAKEEDWLRHKINKAARELDAALAAAGETK
jgi:hypothetical protein